MEVVEEEVQRDKEVEVEVVEEEVHVEVVEEEVQGGKEAEEQVEAEVECTTYRASAFSSL